MTVASRIVDSLKVDLALEHAAIVQYIISGTQLRDAAITDPVRKMAREEMWHFEWLAEAIQDRGGDLVLDRGEVFLSASMATSMREGVAAEDRALSHYAHTLELIGDSDPELTRLINRIVDDERYHRASFKRLAADVDAGGEKAFSAHAIAGPEDLGVVGATIGLEYLTTLQYLWNKFQCGDCEQAEEHFEFAIDEMRHLGWAAMYLPGIADAPVAPKVPADDVRSIGSVAEAREAAQELETKAAKFYSHKIGEAASEELRDDLVRAHSQHEFHRHKLEHPG